MKHKVIFTTAVLVFLLSGAVLAEKNHAEYQNEKIM